MVEQVEQMAVTKEAKFNFDRNASIINNKNRNKMVTIKQQ